VICVDQCQVLRVVAPTPCRKRGLFSLVCSTTLMQVRASCVNGPSVWNGLPLELRLLSRTLSDTFYRRLKTVLFDCAEVGSASE